MKSCPKCGAQMEDQAVFCANCGANYNNPYGAAAQMCIRDRCRMLLNSTRQ